MRGPTLALLKFAVTAVLIGLICRYDRRHRTARTLRGAVGSMARRRRTRHRSADSALGAPLAAHLEWARDVGGGPDGAVRHLHRQLLEQLSPGNRRRRCGARNAGAGGVDRPRRHRPFRAVRSHATFGGLFIVITPIVALDLGPLARSVPLLAALAVAALPIAGMVALEWSAITLSARRLPLSQHLAKLAESWRRLRRTPEPMASAVLISAVCQDIARVGFVFALAWLIYAPGAGVATLIRPSKTTPG